MPEPTYGLLCRSQSTGRLSADDLAGLVVRSTRDHSLAGLTGVLLHAEPVGGAPGLFVQWIEGPEKEVRSLYGAICGDARHVHCEVIAQGPTAEIVGRDGRLFRGWDMHILRLGDLPVTLDSFLDVWLSLRAGKPVGRPASGRDFGP